MAGVNNRPGRTFYARDLMKVPCEEIWDYWGGRLEKFHLVFDDGEIITNVGRTHFSRHHWEILKDYPEVPLLKSFHFAEGAPTVDTSLDLLSNIARVTYLTYDHNFNYEDLWLSIYRRVNELYNLGIVKMEAFQTGGTALDMLDIYLLPEVSQANRQVQAGEITIETAHKIIKKAIMEDPRLRGNHSARLARSKAIKLDQFAQIIGPRGVMTDGDSTMFKHAITRGFFQGIISLHDSMIESRSAVKSLSFTQKPLQDVEYFNRKMQLLCSVVHTLRYDDCQSEGTLSVKMTPGLFKGFEGKRYIDPETGTLKTIMEEDRHLIGQRLQIRSSMFCRHRGKGEVCIACFGAIGWSVPYKTNLGHVCSTEMCHEASQLVLSIKHYDGSAVAVDIPLNEYEQRFIQNGSETGRLKLNRRLASLNIELLLESRPKGHAEGASGISDIRADMDLNVLSPYRITSFSDVSFRVTAKDGSQSYETINVSSGPRLGSLTIEFLKHVLNDNFTIGDDGFYHVKLDGWDFDDDVFTIPLRHINMLDYMSEIENFLRSTTENKKVKMISKGKRLVDYVSAQEALLDLYEMTCQRLSVNIAPLEVILLAMMRGTDEYDYNLPAFDAPAKFETYNRLMENRSHGQLMFYEEQPKALVNVNSYLRDDRPPGILDDLLFI